MDITSPGFTFSWFLGSKRVKIFILPVRTSRHRFVVSDGIIRETVMSCDEIQAKLTAQVTKFVTAFYVNYET
jgi:hypothetical protein